MRQIQTEARLPISALRDIAHKYQVYVIEQASGPGVLDEYFSIDRQVDGPFSVQTIRKARLDAESKAENTEREQLKYNGHPGIPVGPETFANGGTPYTALYAMQGQVADS